MNRITKSQKLQLLGLVTLAVEHYKIIDQARDAMSDILGEEDTHVHDMLYEDVANVPRELNKALKNMGIKVE